ncbi:MAG: glycosyltransferase family 2 protein [Candidatus Omnitrophica bacterium]|nr:glycosyltransferase family 2 protein [Candidatus Omnitrophota bacterium]
MKKVLIIIPAYNEARRLEHLLKALKTSTLDVLVVDDGSTDGSGDVALAQGVQLLKNSANSGKGFSLREGFRHAVEHDYEGVLTMDGDGQHSPQDINAFIKAAEENENCIINGNRMEKTREMPLIRCYTNRFMSFMISLVCGQKVPDTQCGFRYIPSGILKDITLTCNDFEIETEILVKASRKNYTIISIPIKTIYQGETSHIHPVRDTIKFFSYFFKEIFSKK